MFAKCCLICQNIFEKMIDKCFFMWYIYYINWILRSRVSGFNKPVGVVNPVRIRDGTDTVLMEATHMTEVSHWEYSREGRAECLWCVSQETCLNVVMSDCSPKYGEMDSSFLVRRKSAAAVFYRLPQLLFCEVGFLHSFLCFIHDIRGYSIWQWNYVQNGGKNMKPV